MSYQNTWINVIETKEKMYRILAPVTERYLGLPFDERTVESLRVDVNKALIRNLLQVVCEINIETKSIMSINGISELIDKVLIRYLYQ